MAEGFFQILGPTWLVAGSPVVVESLLGDPRNAYIEELEFIAPDRVKLKPTEFVDVEVLTRGEGEAGTG